MYCTGGIRCEYLSSHFKEHGFKNVMMLEGGVQVSDHTLNDSIISIAPLVCFNSHIALINEVFSIFYSQMCLTDIGYFLCGATELRQSGWWGLLGRKTLCV
jgi:hypothetical protein